MSQPDFEKELESLLNKHSMESHSNTPDFVLARYLSGCLLAWNVATNRREEWHGRGPLDGIEGVRDRQVDPLAIGWQPVESSLPEVGVPVLFVWRDRRPEGIIGYGCFNADDTWTDDATTDRDGEPETCRNVTHWMRIPNYPSEGEV